MVKVRPDLPLGFLETAMGSDCGDGVNRKVQVDLAGKWESFETLGEKDGNSICTGHFRARYSSTDLLFASIVVINALSSLP